MSTKKQDPSSANPAAATNPAAKKTTTRPASRNKDGSDESGTYGRMVQSLLDIWNVLASASEPMTPKNVGDRLKERKKTTSPQTAERRLDNAVDLINTIFTQTVLHEEGKPPILHTYPHNGALHVVVEDTFGKPLWTGDMTAVFHESSVNPIPQSTLNRKLPEIETHFNQMKTAAQKKQEITGSDGAAQKDPRAKENVKYTEDYPPISLAAIVEAVGENGKKVVLSRQDYEKWQKTLPLKNEVSPTSTTKTQNAKSPARKFYLKSILTPEEWQILSDMILVYPYISERETNKLLSAMARIAPGSRKWNKLIHAPKTPNAVRFDFIRTLEDAIQNQCKISIEYGRYKLHYKLGGWAPKLQPDGHGYYVTHPYALTWSNGYYYLVCSIEKKDSTGNITQEMRNFRVDRIKNIITPKTIISFEKPADFDVYRYRDRSPVMYPGEVVPIKLRCHVNMLSILMDFFGSAISGYSDLVDADGNPITNIDQDVAYTTVTLEASAKGTKLFALQYVDRVEVLEPKSLRDDISSTLRAAVMDYM